MFGLSKTLKSEAEDIKKARSLLKASSQKLTESMKEQDLVYKKLMRLEKNYAK